MRCTQCNIPRNHGRLMFETNAFCDPSIYLDFYSNDSMNIVRLDLLYDSKPDLFSLGTQAKSFSRVRNL
jgi:hypothetical protein